MKLPACLIALTALFLPLCCFAGGDEIALSLDGIPGEGKPVLLFASDLYLNREYYRAITEFYRFRSYYPGVPLSGKVDFLIAESYANAEKWAEAVANYSSFISAFPDDILVPDAEYKLLYCYIQQGDYALSDRYYSELEKPGVKHKRQEEIRYLYILSLISRQKWQDTINTINSFAAGSRYESKYRTLLAEIPAYRLIPLKSPLKAGICSAILPGAGQFYAKRPGDGVTAFLLTGVTLATAVNCHANNAGFGTLVFSLLAVSFYTANVYNAMNGVNRHNQEATRAFSQEITDKAKEKSVFWSIGIQVSPDRNSLLLKYVY